MFQQQTCILVLGMHRSGTSALTGFLNIFGLSAGTELMSANSTQNAKGFFENKKVVDLNQNELFDRLKIDWDSLYTLNEDWYLEPSLDELYTKAKTIINEDYKDNPTFLIKDPRICLLFPFWEKVFLDLNIAIKVILPFRNPVEVAKSLETRDNFTFDKSLLLWSKYVLYAEYYSRNYNRIFTSFDDLINNPKSLYDNIVKILDIKLPYSYDEKDQEITDFLDSNLKHHNKDINLDNINIEITKKTTELFLRQLNNVDSDVELSNQLRSQYTTLIDVGLEINLNEENISFHPFSNFLSDNHLAIIIHLYYIDLWDEINSYLKKLPSTFDIYITITPQHTAKKLKELKNKLDSNIKLIMVENRGRDVLPFLKIMKVIGLDRYQYICKLHSKKSLHIKYGEEWRKILYDYLIGSRKIVLDIITKLDSDEKVSMITGLNLLTPSSKNYDENEKNLRLLFSSVGITYTKDYNFAAGTMFWLNPKSLYPMEKLLFNIPIFEEEQQQTDGTLAHAFERFFGFICEYKNHSIKENRLNLKTKNSDNEKSEICKRVENNAIFQYQRVIERDEIIISKNEQLKAKDHTIIKREALIIEKNEQLKAKDQTILKREMVINKRDEQLKTKETLVANKNDQLKAKDQTILKREMVIHKRNEQLKTKETLIANKNEQLKAKDQTIRKRETVIASKNKQLNIRNSVIINKNEQLQARDKKIKEIQLSVENYKTELHNLQKEYAIIYNSKSYRITRILRQLKRKLKGVLSR